MKVNITLLAFAAIVSLVRAATPFYGWTNTKIANIESKKEVLEPVNADQVALEIKAILDSDQAFSAVLFLRPNIETETLPSLLENEFPRIRNIIKQNQKENVERAFNEVGEGLKDQLFSLFPNSIRTVLDSESSYKNLMSEIKQAPKPFIQQVYVIEVPEIYENNLFDAVV